MDADGSDLRRLEGDGGGDFAWSPDGSRIAAKGWLRVEPGSTEYCPDEWYIDFCASAEWISIIDVGTGAQRDLAATRFPNPGESDPTKEGPAIQGWSWSPDGRSILLWRGPGTRPLVIDVETGQAAELPWAADSAPSWQRVADD